VIEGELHPDIADNGASQTLRSAVGIDGEGRAHFAISEEPLSFGRIARFYRDELGIDNALLLASGDAALWEPASSRLDSGRAGPILVVSRVQDPPE
jgi:uncharacterized protein YigE (DUF2233 family)